MASFVEYLKLKDLIATLVTIKIQHDVKNLRHSNSNTQPIIRTDRQSSHISKNQCLSKCKRLSLLFPTFQPVK